jgi:hypothetical protein
VRQPTALLQAASFIRDHGQRTDLFQDSRLDGNLLISAVSERRIYVHATNRWQGYRPDITRARLQKVQSLMQLRDAGAVKDAARRLGLGWFLLQWPDAVGWPGEILDHPVFARQTVRLYRFD